MNLWTIYFSLVALLLPPVAESRLVVVQHDDYIIKAHVAIDKTEIKTQNELVYHYFQRGRILESQGDFVGYLLDGDISKALIDNTLIEKGYFSNGLKDGNWKSWYNNGVLKSSEQWKLGKQDGQYEYFDTSGKISERGGFKDNVKDGKVERYQDGELLETIAYKAGKEIFRTRANTPSKAYAQNKTPVNPNKEGPVSNSPEPKAFKASIYYTDKSTSLPVPNVSVIISNVQTGEMLRKVSNEAGQVDFNSAPGMYNFQATLEPYERDMAQVALVTEEQHVWIELSKAATCQPQAYLLKNNNGQIINTKTEVQINNLTTGQKEMLLASNGRVEACMMCGQQYKLQLFNDDHVYLEEIIVLDADCRGNKQEFVLEQIDVAPRVEPQRTARVFNQNSRPAERVISTPSSNPSTSNYTTPITTPPVERTHSGNYYVVVGTFGAKENADKRLSKLQAAGYTNGSMLRDQSSGLWSVYAERYTDYDAAKSMERRIESSGAFKVFVKILE